MVTKKRLRKDLDRICRACLNDKYSLRLEPQDCYYKQYPYLCTCQTCGNARHIVSRLRWTANLKLLSAHAPKPEPSRHGEYERKNQGGSKTFPGKV